METKYMDKYGPHVFARDLKKELGVIVRGKGVYLYDDKGKEYIDGCAGSEVANIGHGVEEVAEAIFEQAKTVAFTHLSRWITEPLMRAAQLITDISPEGLDWVYFVSGGSEAVESSIKLARSFFLERDGADTPKRKIIARWHGFHGNTLGALSATGHMPRRRKYDPMLIDFPHIPTCYCYRCPFGKTYPSCQVECARALEEKILAEGAETVAAFIAEPVIGAASGAVVPVDEYWPMVREICDKYDVLLIDDEVMAGFGRTGRHFAIDHWGVVPDLIACAKGMSAGYSPLGSVIISSRIRDTIAAGTGRFTHGHTYAGNPLSAATVVAVLEYYMKHNLAANSAQMGELLFALMEPLKKSPIVGDIRGRGLFCGVELVQSKATGTPFPAQAAMGERLTQKCVAHGLVVYPGAGHAQDGKSGDHVLVGPPLTINQDEVRELVRRFSLALGELEAEVKSGIR